MIHFISSCRLQIEKNWKLYLVRNLGVSQLDVMPQFHALLKRVLAALELSDWIRGHESLGRIFDSSAQENIRPEGIAPKTFSRALKQKSTRKQ
jgi:hypothetical protein